MPATRDSSLRGLNRFMAARRILRVHRLGAISG